MVEPESPSSYQPSDRRRLAGVRSRARRAAAIALWLAGSAGGPSLALDPQPLTIFHGEANGETEIRVLLFDASLGPSAGIAGAQFQYGSADGLQRGTAGADGTFTLLLTLPDDDYLPVWGWALGFLPTLQTFRVADVRQAGALQIGLRPAAARVDSEIRGVVTDASRGNDTPIGNATVEYIYHNYEDAFPEIHGSVLTDAEGRYAFEVPLGSGDYVELNVSAPGFATFSTYAAASQVFGGMPFDIALAPVGGEVDIFPTNLSVECTGSFEVTIRNTSADETLVILNVAVGFDYGEGVYGQEFDVDLSQLHFPVSLASGQQITFPVTFHAGGQFPSRVMLTVVSGARNGAVRAVYYGRNDGCHPTCTGDCDRDGSVSIAELVRGVGIALGKGRAEACAADDTNRDFVVSIEELVVAVRHALEGCEPGHPTVTPTPTLTATQAPFTATGTAATATATPTATSVGTVPPTPASDALSALQATVEQVCHLNGPGPTDKSARAVEHGFTLHCLPGPGHETRADLKRYADAEGAAAQFAVASESGTAREFHDLPAVYWEIPFRQLEGADRFLVWQLDCWVMIVHSFDDTSYTLTPQPFTLSEAIFTNARDVLLAECPTGG